MEAQWLVFVMSWSLIFQKKIYEGSFSLQKINLLGL